MFFTGFISVSTLSLISLHGYFVHREKPKFADYVLYANHCPDQPYQSCNDTHQTVGGNEANDGSSCRGCCHEEDTCSYNHHDLLLDILH